MTYLVPGGAEQQPVRVDAAPWGVAPGRTYIIPDDWYANHGLAPGDARLPQKPIEAGWGSDGNAAWGDKTSGRLVPTPPMRSYFGPPPMRLVRDSFGRMSLPLANGLSTRSPFAVSDVMWGVHGLDGDDPRIDALVSKLQKDMKKQMIEQAAVSTGISVALATIPIAGWAASAAYAVVQGIVGAQNQREAQQVMADTEQKAKAIVAKYDAKLSDAQDVVWKAETPAAVQLATSCTDLQGLGGWFSDLGSNFGVKNIVRKGTLFVVNPVAPLIKPASKMIKGVAPHPVDKVVDKATSPERKLEKNINTGIDVLSGQEAVKKAKAARAKILAQVEADLSAQYRKSVAGMNHPAFRDNLRKQLAIKLRADPSIQATISSQCAIMPKTGTYVDPRTGVAAQNINESMPAGSKAAPWAGLAAAAATILALGLAHK